MEQAHLMKINTVIELQAEALTDILIIKGELQIKPYELFDSVSSDSIRYFMHLHGIYCLPTLELLHFLQKEIGSSTAIEIGCGIGAIAKALNIPPTDSRLQERPEIKAHYASIGQPTVQYPKWVEKYDAIDAVKEYKPDVVIGSYIIKKYDGESGNMWGVDELEILALVKKYIHIGDEETHSKKPLMKKPFTKHNPEWLITRGKKGFIGIWSR